MGAYVYLTVKVSFVEKTFFFSLQGIPFASLVKTDGHIREVLFLDSVPSSLCVSPFATTTLSCHCSLRVSPEIR